MRRVWIWSTAGIHVSYDKMLRQQILNIHLAEELCWQNLIVQAPNQAVAAALQSEPVQRETVLVWGQQGAGKSHVLQACCHRQRAFYVPLAGYAEFSPQMLEGLEAFDWVCVDDLDAIAGQAAWEQAIFHLYNRVQAAGGKMVFAASCAPSALGLWLADLHSRVCSGLVFQLHRLDDAGLAQALQRRAAYQGVVLPDAVVQYMLRHYARDASQLFANLKLLEQATLVEQRPLTIPFVKSILV